MDLNKIVYMWFEREPFLLETRPPQNNEHEPVKEDEPKEEEPPQEEVPNDPPPQEEPPKEVQPPKEEPPQPEPDPIWTDPVKHFFAFKDEPLEVGFDTSKISFGIVQMVQHELNLLLVHEKRETLPITGVVGEAEIVLMDHFTGQRAYQPLYDYIDGRFPTLHMAQ